jgi:hypothetical protein
VRIKPAAGTPASFTEPNRSAAVEFTPATAQEIRALQCSYSEQLKEKRMLNGTSIALRIERATSRRLQLAILEGHRGELTEFRNHKQSSTPANLRIPFSA